MPSFLYLEESAVGLPTLMIQVSQLWVPAWQEWGYEDTRLLQQQLQGAPLTPAVPGICWITCTFRKGPFGQAWLLVTIHVVGQQGRVSLPELFCLWLKQISLEIFFTGDG